MGCQVCLRAADYYRDRRAVAGPPCLRLMLHVHVADRADRLLAPLSDLALDSSGDPFAPSVIAVPTRGVERWVTQQLAAVHSICANIVFPSPQRITRDAVALASGIDPVDDPWRPGRAAWPIAQLLDEHRHEAWLSVVRRHLDGAGEPGGRRLALAQHLAVLFDRYARDRPAMLKVWEAGRAADDDGRALPDDLAWQARLWALLAERLASVPHPAARVADACASLRDQPGLLELPTQLALFNLTRLPAADLQVLEAIAAHRDLHLLVLHPSPALWERLSDRPAPGRRDDDPTRTSARHPLLASWGHDVRELQLLLNGLDVDETTHYTGDSGSHDAADASLLRRLQDEIRTDTPPEAPSSVDRQDRSVQLHACHGRGRQVEVLRDVVLGLLADHPDLEPRDIVVMCPDIEQFAPLISATFGAGQILHETTSDQLPVVRMQLADRSLRQTNTVLSAVSALLELVSGRMGVSELLDFADRDPVRRRFGLDDDALARLERWVEQTGTRWAIRAAHRADVKLDSVADGTWQPALDRIALGAVLPEPEQGLWRGVLPLDDVDSSAIDLAGRLCELVDRLEHTRESLTRTQPIGDWVTAIADAAAGLCATGPRDSWQKAELARLLDDLATDAADSDIPVTPAELRGLVASRLAGRPTRANFRTGAVTCCTMAPMRSVPHRVVCLLGLDDDAFPRKAARDGDNLLLRHPRLGERDPRSEDRQLLLDAVMSATQTLVITYTGNDERTNQPRPPAVPVLELLDAIERTGGTEAAATAVTRHPLQPFDPENFRAGRLRVEGPSSFDERMLHAARALATPAASTDGRLLTTPLALRIDDPVALADLIAFVEHPVKAFLRQRLGIRISDLPEAPSDELDLNPGGLTKYHVGQRITDMLLTGTPIDDAVAAEAARGGLPPTGALRDRVLDEVTTCAQAIVARAQGTLGSLATTSADVDVPLPSGRRLAGTVTGVGDGRVQRVAYSSLGPKHRLAAWVRLLALAAGGSRVNEAVTVARAGTGARLHRISAPSDADLAAWAADELDRLIDLRDRGLREPLPVSGQAAVAFAAALPQGVPEAMHAADEQWTSGYDFDREDRDPEHQLAFGSVLTFDDLWAWQLPAGDEAGWAPGVPSRFGCLAARLWNGLLAREQL